ncbi:MFS transporter [Sphingomonas naphthae]|uniref:MFS transporter n=1 Tax=Sphingomonas naphthae TaxID=1813468 RepID=A0ABY7TMU3_9SPHN|nr:MFS transporter [Sphingomonas naphthae]WCT74552.1 MFS transporter [Sphingomonas naphthae]
MDETTSRPGILASIRPYCERAPLAAFALGLSSGFPFAMIAATLTTRLAQSGIEKKSITTFALAILAYNLKPLWAWMVDGVRLPILGRLGQRVSWMLFAAVLVVLAVFNLARLDPTAGLLDMAYAAVLVGVAGATFDIVIDAYRIELLEPRQLGVGAGMSQYGYRLGNVGAGSLALFVAGAAGVAAGNTIEHGWTVGYMACTLFALPAVVTALLMGEPERRRAPAERRGLRLMIGSIVGPFVEFFKRQGVKVALLILAFILFHKIGDTLANLSLRLLLNDNGFSNEEIATYDVMFGLIATLLGTFVGGILYARMGLKRSVLLSLVLMAFTNLGFAGLAAAGHNNWALSATIGFENFASGIGGVCVTAYFSALCDLRFTAAQYALISAGSSIVGRFVTGTTAGALIEGLGYVNYYLLTTIIAVPGILLFWLMMRMGLIDSAMGTAGEVGEGDARDEVAA